MDDALARFTMSSLSLADGQGHRRQSDLGSGWFRSLHLKFSQQIHRNKFAFKSDYPTTMFLSLSCLVKRS